MSKYSDALDKMQNLRQAVTVLEQPVLTVQPAVTIQPPAKIEARKSVISIDRKENDPNFAVARKSSGPCKEAVLSSILERWRDGETVVKTFQRDALVSQLVPRDHHNTYQELRAAFRALTTNQ